MSISCISAKSRQRLVWLGAAARFTAGNLACRCQCGMRINVSRRQTTPLAVIPTRKSLAALKCGVTPFQASRSIHLKVLLDQTYRLRYAARGCFAI
jgi:hypothetical protein